MQTNSIKIVSETLSSVKISRYTHCSVRTVQRYNISHIVNKQIFSPIKLKEGEGLVVEKEEEMEG